VDSENSQVNKMIGHLIRKLYWTLPNSLFKVVAKFRMGITSETKIEISFIDDKINLIEHNSPNEFSVIWLAERKRISKYRSGIQERIEQVGLEYCLANVPMYDGGWVIDVGANIGEFSMFINKKKNGVQFICIEPSKKEAECCDLNLRSANHRTFQLCLWESDGIMDFYHANETGDSSLFPSRTNLPSSKVKVATLDSILKDFFIEKIMVLKLEAEGAEPEILKGSSRTLTITEYVTADLGPERGVERMRTFEECNEILESQNFQLIKKHLGKRETYLYKNMKLLSKP
jgi:FkbM family methyltransferase